MSDDVSVPIQLPALVRQRAMAHGEAGRRWLAELPEVVSSLCERWGLEPGRPLAGGTASYVVAATTGSGEACVLKIAMPLDLDEQVAVERSVLVHQLADGQGCARLLRSDVSSHALLLERLGPNLHDLSMPLPEVLDTVALTLRTFWRPVDTQVDLPTGAEKAAWLARYVTDSWEELDRPCPREVIDLAVALCEVRAAAFDPASAVLVHGDAHGWNTLTAGDGTCKLVDPEGLRSEPEHDLAVLMREYNEPLLAGSTAWLVQERAEHLAARCGLDARAIWEWGFIERVSTGLAGLRDFDGEGGLAFLEVARRCC